jgi:hypothetical protein
MASEAENDKPVLHGAVDFQRITSQQFFKLILIELVNRFCGVMSEKLDHGSGRLQVFTHSVKSPQSHLGYFEPDRQIDTRGSSEKPPTVPSPKQIKVIENPLRDTKAPFQV